MYALAYGLGGCGCSDCLSVWRSCDHTHVRGYGLSSAPFGGRSSNAIRVPIGGASTESINHNANVNKRNAACVFFDEAEAAFLIPI